MKNSKPIVVGVHLLNDFSGSPKVFRQALQSLASNGHPVHLFTNGNRGFLSDLPQVTRFRLPYRRRHSKILTLLSFLFAQVFLFFRLLRYWRTDVTIYVNTLLPFGAALAGWLTGKKVIYHLHEVSLRPRILMRFLSWVMNRTADRIIAVSEFVAKENTGARSRVRRVYNALEPRFQQTAAAFRHFAGRSRSYVLMLCSLKAYKGIRQFVDLATALPQFAFELVLNAEPGAVSDYFRGIDCPPNLRLYPAQSNVHAFYQRADLVLNLSLPDQWVETFGLTAIEAMAYGLPVIVPPAGGIAELVRDGENGFQVDPYDHAQLVLRTREILSDVQLYALLSKQAWEKSNKFGSARFEREIQALFAPSPARLRSPNLNSKSQIGTGPSVTILK